MNAEQHVPQFRFKDFSDSWVQRDLGDLAEIVRGASPRPIQDPKWFDDSSEIGWLRISDVTEQNGRIHHLDQHISEAGQAKTRVLTEPHLLLSIAATVGKPLVNYVKTGVHDGFLIFMNPKFDLEFMFQWLESYRDKWSRYGQPGSQVNLNSDLVKNQSISIPSMDEQQKLGEFFTSIDNLIAANQRKLDLLKEQKKGYLQKMFPKNGAKVPELRFAGFADDWEQRKFGELYKKNLERNKDHFSSDRTISIATMRFKKEGNGAAENSLVSYKVLREGDIAFEGHTSKRFAFGRFVLNDIGDGIMSPRFTTLRPTQDMPIKFWKQYIHYEPIMRYPIVNSTKLGTMMNELVVDEFLNQPVLVPELSEQEKIGSFFQQLDETIALHQRKLDLLKEQKKGYLQKMFAK
ncbi:EcoKI restriction-modification system protein HsdS [Lacticaseibacillus paracasei]|uniref:restriction endonuclease subunit S n=1 Tax=Lacticaseibacillus paracasei TaxID=1597 RepID=UPI000F0B47BF|nr:restriction endonuclease subunit S [Lacticaseibacillus paracasei]RNE42414.1 EcoKI restriction-modification system protein HsdS [Lacticaseibacillus paracasei]